LPGVKNCAACAEVKAERQLIKLYGITRAEWKALLDQQKGICACCEKPLGDDIVVDHNHINGLIRGLVHKRCNDIIRDDVELMRKAAAYVERFAAIHDPTSRKDAA
jgi:hypothetical protein